MKFKLSSLIALLLFIVSSPQIAKAGFVHPGGLQTKADLDRMKEKVNAGAHPWIDGWNLMIKDFKAKKTYVPKPRLTIGGKDGTRQQAVRDADAAYFNTLQWYVTGDVEHAECAVRILNAWSASINQVVTGELFQLPIPHMVQAAELLRVYPGWKPEDLKRFQDMCLNYFYPTCHKFLSECGSWPGWDGPANAAILEIGVLCDDQAKFDEAVSYFKNGIGGGSIMNNVCQESGQLSEIGRDQPHAIIGPAFTADMCQFAWNQGVDLFGYANNRLLAGFEYFCKYNLNHPVEWVPYNDCNDHNFFYPSSLHKNRIYHNPVYELIYNHYVGIKKLQAPYTKAMINLSGFYPSSDDNLGYCALTYTLSDTTTVFQPRAIPVAPENLMAASGISNVFLQWTAPSGDVANGYTISRSTSAKGSFSKLIDLKYNTTTEFLDTTVRCGKTYYYKVAAINQSGTSEFSNVSSATSANGVATLPSGWTHQDVGAVADVGSTVYAEINNKTFIIKGSGAEVSGSEDSYSSVNTKLTGNFTIIARISDIIKTKSNKNKVGLMIRETLESNSKNITINLSDSETRFTWLSARLETGGKTSWPGKGDSHTWIPVWFKLQRSGNTFIAYQSQDGKTWFSVGSTTIAMSDTCFAGMFVCAGDSRTGVTSTATFDNVSLSRVFAKKL